MTSLYIHIPFCERKCLFCSFVVAVGQEHRQQLYLDCLEREASSYRGTKVSTIYLGGGTPTLLKADSLRRLFDIVRSHFAYPASAEFTIEANPEGITPEKLDVLHEAGVNRISLGVQSLNDRYLQHLGRCHDAARAAATFAQLRKSDFKNINVDLMCSFPEQTLAELRDDVESLVRWGSEHVSLYTLTVDPQSRFFAQQVKETDNIQQRQQYELIVSLLEEHGYPQYEISNFAKPGMESRHNLNYWQGGNYIGLGVGAHAHQDGVRFWNVARLNEYMERLQAGEEAVEDQEVLSSDQRFWETVLFGLRMNAGVDLAQLEQRYGYRIAPDRRKRLDDFVREGWLKRSGDRLAATARGRLVLDELAAYLI